MTLHGPARHAGDRRSLHQSRIDEDLEKKKCAREMHGLSLLIRSPIQPFLIFSKAVV
ncbi:hypothetical protein Bca4012_038182 [Brassica carinata]